MNNAATWLPFLKHVIEFLGAFLNFFHEVSLFLDDPQVVIFVPLLLEFSVLVFQIFYFLFQGSYRHILFIKFLFQKNIVHFVSLLDNYQIVVCMGQLTDVVLQLHEFLLHVFFILRHAFFIFLSLFFFFFILLKQIFMFIVNSKGSRVIRDKIDDFFIIGDFFQPFDQLFFIKRFSCRLNCNFLLFLSFLVSSDLLSPDWLNLSLKVLLLGWNLVTFNFQWINFFFLDQMQVSFHFQLSFKFVH